MSSIYAKNIAYGKFMKQVSNLQVCVTFQHCGTLNSIKWWDPMCIAHHWRLVKELHWKGLGFCRVQSVVIRMNRVWFYASCICNSAIDTALTSILNKRRRRRQRRRAAPVAPLRRCMKPTHNLIKKGISLQATWKQKQILLMIVRKKGIFCWFQ